MTTRGGNDFVASLLEAMIGAAVVFDAQGVVVHVNDAALEIVGGTREEFLGKRLAELPVKISTSEGRALDVREFLATRALETGEDQPQVTECVHRRDGTTREILIQARPIRGEGGGANGAVVSFLDITARVHAEQRLRRSEESWRLLARHVPDIVVVVGLDGRMLFINREDEAGTPERVGLIAWEAVDEEYREPWRLAFEECKARGEIVRLTTSAASDTKGGRAFFEVTLVPVLDDGRVERVVAVAEDLTERRELMARLADQDRRAGVGLLAASVAHEILNPLTYVLANIEYALRESGRDPERLRASLGDALEGALRMKQVVNDLRILGRGRDERLYVDVRSVVESAVRLAGPALSSATVVVDLPEVAPVPASEAQLCQVTLNLLVNAGHALRDRAGPREVRVTARNHADSELVSLSVTDNGPGIPARIRDRIFDPFFTTKVDGTGLGLSLARDVVSRLGGRIEVDTEEGRGTTFTVTLPTTRPTTGSEPPAAAAR